MYTILYVDDEPDLLDVTKIYLEQDKDMTVETCASAKEALAILTSRKYDVIVSDYEMPQMDGLGLLSTVRKNGDRTPFIIFSGKGREHVIIEAFNSGADFFIQKGSDVAAQYTELRHKIRQAIEKRRIEEALIESEAHYRAVVEDQTEFICRFLPDGTITFANTAFCNNYGKKIEELIGKKFFPSLDPVDLRSLSRFLRTLTPQRPAGSIEHKTTLPDGRIQWQQWTDRAIFDRFGALVEYQSVGRDVTDRKMAEMKLKQYSEHLEELVEEGIRKLSDAQRLATIGEMATMVGHDLRNPLQVIVNEIYLVKTTIGQMLPEEREMIRKYHIDDTCRNLEEQSAYMNKIVSDLQDYARPVRISSSRFFIRSFFEEIAATTYHDDDIMVDIDIDPGFEVETDRDLLQRAVSNLLINAFQSITGKGQIGISVQQEGEWNRIEIKDTGVGMDQRTLAQVFRPLFTTKSKGTGLGLNVSRRLIAEL